MPIEYISANQSTTYDVQGSDDVIVLEGVAITSIDDAIEANIAGVNNGITVTVQGALYGQTGIDLWQNSTENNDIWIYIGSEGHVHGTEDAIAIRQGDDNVVVNFGEITAQQAGVYFQGGEATIVNHGSITSFGNSGQGAVIFNATAEGSNIRELTNTGIISGAPQSTGTSFYSTIQNSSGDEFYLSNSGSILADGARAVYSSAIENFFENSGLIDGQVVTTGVTTMTNSGTINGDVTLSGSDDSYFARSTGLVTGSVSGGNGNDTLVGADAADRFHGGSGNDVLSGGGGDDTIYGEDGNDVMYGGNGHDVLSGEGQNDRIHGHDGDDTMTGGLGNDTMIGGFGADSIEGGSGSDQLHGGDQNDTIFGENGNDTILGGNGDDVLSAGGNNDTVYGNHGDDTITGGTGVDRLYGGLDSDTFVFNSEAEIGSGGAADVIADFQQGMDVIDLSGVDALSGVAGDQEFTFVGTAAHSGAGATLRYVNNGIDTLVYGDTSANGAGNFTLRLSGSFDLTADDFIL